MKLTCSYISQIVLRVVILSTGLVAAPATADTIIRIIGDRATQSPNESPSTEYPPSSIKGGRTFGIVGDKVDIDQKKVPGSPTLSEIEAKERWARLAAEEERLAKEKSEFESARLQAAAKAAEERRAAEKFEQDRLARLRAEEDKAIAEAVRQAEIKKEQEYLAARKEAEARKKAEQDNNVALKAEEERLAVAQRDVLEKLRLEEKTLVQQYPSASVDEAKVPDNKTPLEPDTAWDLYLFAKAIDPALGRTISRVTGSKADSDYLLSTLMPHLDSSASVKRISQTLVNYAPEDITNGYNGVGYNVTARLTLLHVPTLYSMSAAAAGLNVEEAGVAAARQNLILKFTDSYFALLKAQTDKQIAQGEINRLRQVLDQSQAFLKAGTGDIISVYEAQSRLDSAGADLTKSESNLRLAEQKLSSLVGKPVKSVVNYLTHQPIGPDPDNIDWWVATMEKEQPVVRQAREGVAQTTEQKKAAKAEYLPILQATGGYDVSRGTASLPTAEVRQWYIGASISMPLYSGGETSAKVRRAVATEDERRHAFDETMDQQRENVKQAFFNLRYNISLIKAQDQRKASAEIQLAAIKKGRKIGTRNAIDVLNAEQAYSIALRDYRYALYDNVIRVIQLKSAAGILAEADIAELSKIAVPTPDIGLSMLVSQVSK